MPYFGPMELPELGSAELLLTQITGPVSLLISPKQAVHLTLMLEMNTLMLCSQTHSMDSGADIMVLVAQIVLFKEPSS